MRTSKLIDLSKVKNYPFDDPNASVMKAAKGTLYVFDRYRKWNNTTKKQEENRVLIGRIRDNVYYTMEEYHRIFKRDGTPKVMPNPPSVYKLKKKASPAVEESSPVAEQNASPGDSSVSASEGLPAKNIRESLGFQEKQVGVVPVLWSLSERIHLFDDLCASVGIKRAAALLSLAFAQICCTGFTALGFEAWSRGRILPLPIHLDDNEVGALLNAVGAHRNEIHTFFALRMARLSETEILGFDSTTLPTQAQNIAEARIGKNKKKVTEKQVHFGLLYAQKTHEPVMFRTFDGNVPDVMTFRELVRGFDECLDNSKKLMCTILDRGYCSQKNIEAAAETGRRFLCAANISSGWVSTEFLNNLTELDKSANDIEVPKEHITGFTCKLPWTHDVWIHIYKDHVRAAREKGELIAKCRGYMRKLKENPDFVRDSSFEKKYFKRLKKSSGERVDIEIDYRKIDKDSQTFGMFANVTTWECSAEEAYKIYITRDAIEKTFRFGKTGLKLDKIRSHTSDGMYGRLFVGFLAMILSTQINYLTMLHAERTTKSGKTMTFRRTLHDDGYNCSLIAKECDPVRIICDDVNGLRYSEVISRIHNIAARLDMPEAFVQMPSFLMPEFKAAFVADEDPWAGENASQQITG